MNQHLEVFDDPKLIATINQDLDPCDDFYKYVCDGFVKNNAVLGQRSSVNTMSTFAEDLENRIYAIIENNRFLPENEEDDFVQQMYLFYDTCMDEAGRRRENSRAVLNKIASLKSSPSALMSFNTDWLLKSYPLGPAASSNVLAGARLTPSIPFYSYSILSDLRNTSRGIFTLNTAPIPPVTGGPPFFFDPMFDNARENFRKMLKSILTLLIEDESATGSHRVFAQPASGNWSLEIERRVDSYMTVETARAKLFSAEGEDGKEEDMEQQRELDEDPYKNIKYVRMSEIKQYLKSFDLAQFWNAILPAGVLSSQGLTSVDQIELVSFIPLEYWKLYDDVILPISPQAMSDYLEWFIIFNYLPLLDNRYMERMADFAGQQSPPIRLRCRMQTMKYFSHQLDKLYAETFFPEDIRTSVTDLFDYIDEAFGDMLEEVDWMDDDTRDEALDKLDAMEIHMGYVDEVFDDERIEEIYEGYDLRAGMSYVEMIAMIDEWRAKYELEELAQEPPFYQSAIVDINAAYYPDRNAIFAMMSILQGPYYTKSRPTVMNFAVIGAVLGHEITHGFDHQGSRHDVDGNLRDWWDPETKENFNEEKQCIVDQYSNYIFKLNETYSQPLDGVLMQGENIADHGGIRAAYKAWQYFLDDVEDGLAEDPSETYSIGTIEDFSDEQLFFIAAGFEHCYQMQSEYLYSLLNVRRDPHAPGEARVNIVFGNQPEFARAFQCPRGSGMNPVDKCSVW
ncbi:peptidase family m13 domain-containing protein [Ditylenchus destructor]|nr:peptidase family m13 domain-containing protein [Ditylenchus destructor]